MRTCKEFLRTLSLLFVALALTPITIAQNKTETGTTLSQSSEKQIIVGPNIQVSKAFGSSAHGEIHLAADPKNANRLLGGSMVYDAEHNGYKVVAYASDDGGMTWLPVLTFKDDFYHSDPAAGFGPDGSSYFLQILTTNLPNQKINTYFHRKKAGMIEWLPPVVFPLYDRHYVTVDDTGGRYHGHLYVAGMTGSLPGIDAVRSASTLGLLRSADGGSTFLPPAQLVATPARIIFGLAPGAVLSDGTLVIPFAETQVEDLTREGSEGSPVKPNGNLKVLISEDGGETFARAVTISNITFGHNIISNPSHFGFAVDRSRGYFRDRLYAVWSNTYSGGSNIQLSYSADKGKTWSNPVVVNDDRQAFDPTDGRVHFRPVMAVNEDGAVGILWNDRRESANNLDWSVRFTTSLDGGETFLPSVKVSEAPFTHGNDKKIEIRASGYGGGYGSGNRSGPLRIDLKISQFYLAGGHTGGMAADANGVFHAFWVDNRTGISQVWTAPINVRGKAVRNGSEELAPFDDITDKLMIVCSNIDYNTSHERLSLDLQIQNVSREPIYGPIKARVISLNSAAGGIVKFLGSDGRESGAGTILDFTPFLLPSHLEPGAKSRPKRIEFGVSDLQPLEQRIKVRPLSALGYSIMGWGGLQLVQIDARLFGRKAPAQSSSSQSN